MSGRVGVSWWKKGYWALVQGENFIGSFLLLIIRVYWGILLVMTGLGKWSNIYGVADFFASLDLPLPLFSAYLVATVEFLGGVSLVLGLYSRIATLFLSTVFFVAYATAHQEVIINFFANPGAVTQEEPFLYLLASLIVLCFGSGFISVDYWWERKSFGKAL